MTFLRACIERWVALATLWRALAAVLWAGFLWQMSARTVAPPRPGSWRPLLHNSGHVVVYAVLGALVLLALHNAFRSGRDRALLAFVLTALYGVVDEVHQSFVPTRAASVGDVLSDAAGAVLGIAVTLWVWRGDRAAARVAAVTLPVGCLCVGIETFTP